MLAQRIHQRGLAGADWPADADAQRTVQGFGHERNNLVYWVSCSRLARSARNAALARSASGVVSALLAVASTTGSSAASTRWPSLWPSGMSRTPAEMRFAVTAWR